MVELHRAQARLWSAEVISVCRRHGQDVQLSELYNRLESKPRKYSEMMDILREYEDDPVSRQRAKSLVADGVHFLNRAEPMLRERRRNVWWTTWYLERYLRAIAMSVWATIFDAGTPVPFLGLEFAPAANESLADRLLRDAVRLVSYDVYRMATLIEAYASCAKALQVRLLKDNSLKASNCLSGRLRKMENNLEDAIRNTNRVEQQRDSAWTILPERRAGRVDERITKYVKSVTNRYTRMVENGLVTNLH